MKELDLVEEFITERIRAEQFAAERPPDSSKVTLEDRLLELLREREARDQKRRNEEVVAGKYIDPLSLKPKPVSSLADAFPDGATERKLDNFTRRTGIKLSHSFRSWLGITNGAAGFFGVRPRRKDDDIEREMDFWVAMKKEGWLPVASDDFGNRYVQLVSDDDQALDPVCYAEMIGGYISHVVASDMLHFALFYLEDEMYPGFHSIDARKRFGIRRIRSPWPFSKRYTLARDPNLKHVTGLPMPWKA